ncbi:MAG: HAMP domain-containing sensor histidine kinase [Phycisphaerales bacterium]
MQLKDVRAWFHELPLASKSLLLFGAASALIIGIALLVPLFRMNALVGAGQMEQSRALADAWASMPRDGEVEAQFGAARVRVLDRASAVAAASDDRAVRAALRKLDRDDAGQDWMQTRWDGGARVYVYARAQRAADGSVSGLTIIDRRSDGAALQLIVNVFLVIAAGSFVLALALVVFALIASRLILEPVEQLKQTAERVREGSLETRADIRSGDEFEELAETFNLMLAELQKGQDRLRAINAAMDVKLSELTEANVALYESAKLKGDFVASVSHELRTPLNSVIGFAELLLEIARRETAAAAAGEPETPDPDTMRKRERYLVNIVTAGRTLLEMIESLLEMAKIEAGRVEVNPEPMVLGDVCEGLIGLIYPLANRKGIVVESEVEPTLPVIETDVKKFQQVIFNLLSNAVKFTSRDGGRGTITLRAERLPEGGPDGAPGERVRVSIIDDGPGIAPEEQGRIFGKFQQLDEGHTKRHAGTGLGLAIVAELTDVLQGEVQLVSEVGRGSMFSVILPTRFDMDRFRRENAQRREKVEADRAAADADAAVASGAD